MTTVLTALTPLFAILIPIVVVAIIVYSVFRNSWQLAGPNEALIVSGLSGGKDGRTFKIVTGQGTLVIPGLQTARKLSLILREALLTVDCVTKQGIPVKIVGVCIYKVGDDQASITNAARRFLGQEASMERNIQTLFDGHLRSIVGTLTVEQLISDRVALTDATRDAAKSEVNALGLSIESLQIKEIGDPTNYITNLSLPHIAEVKKAARIATAQADQEAAIAEQEAKAQTAKATSDSAIKQNQYAAASQQASAEAAQAGPLAAARAEQAVVLENTKLAELQADRTQKELEVTVRRPADAEAYRVKTVAEGQAQAAIAQANGEATRVKVSAEADATRVKFESEAAAARLKVTSEAQATSAQLIGAAEGTAIAARGNAEAEVAKNKALAEAAGVKARAEAIAQNKEAIIGQIIAEKLPDIVKAASDPIGHIKEITVLNGMEGFSGFANLALGSALKMLPQLMGAIKDAAGSTEPTPVTPSSTDVSNNGKTPVSV